MRFAPVVLLALTFACPALAQMRLTEQEGAALWKRQAAPILEAVTTVETLRACKLVDEGAGFRANGRLQQMAHDLYWRDLGAPVSQDRWVGDFSAAEAWGRAEATPATCAAIRNSPEQSGGLKLWVDRLAYAGR